MNKHRPYHWLVFLVCVALSLHGYSFSSAQETELEGDATTEQEIALEEDPTPLEFDRIIEFDRELHFLTLNDEAVVVSPGAYRVDPVTGGLRLTPRGEDQSKAIMIQAQPTTHEEPVDNPEPVTISREEDQQIVMLLMPDGKALQAVGSSSGILPRGFMLKKGTFKLAKIPVVQAILTNPLGPVTPRGYLYLKGRNFGAEKGEVFLQLSRPSLRSVGLKIIKWSDTKITTRVPGAISGVPDHQASFSMKTAKGAFGRGWAVQFKATRVIKKLKAVTKVRLCSTGADMNNCAGLSFPAGGTCSHKLKIDKSKTLSGFHVNCDKIIDWDDGKDLYSVRLFNGWVIDSVHEQIYRSSKSERVTGPTHRKTSPKIKGWTGWDFSVKWKVSPGPDAIQYGYTIFIKGPNGISHKKDE